jgi:hypothetical protein
MKEYGMLFENFNLKSHEEIVEQRRKEYSSRREKINTQCKSIKESK